MMGVYVGGAGKTTQTLQLTNSHSYQSECRRFLKPAALFNEFP
jgi:hypothetical protein